MASYILRRILWSVLTVVGVMVLTFLLFRVVASDIASVWVGKRATIQEKADWRHRNGYGQPLVLNLHSRLIIVDKTRGERPFAVKDAAGSNAANALALIIPTKAQIDAGQTNGQTRQMLIGRWVFNPDRRTPIESMTANEPLLKSGRVPQTPRMSFHLSDGSELAIPVTGLKTAGDLLDRINGSPHNAGLIKARISSWSVGQLFHSQFFHHLKNSVTFQSRSFKDNRRLTRIIAEHAPYSLAITVPAMAIGWVLAMIVSTVVAYYRGSIADRVGVLLSVLGMCVPYLAWMMYGQQFMFWLSPRNAYGIFYRGNVYLPIAIMVVAGLGGSVRFYRTIILDETHRDYVRTARAKGASLPSVLFKHVLKNCMLPILTNLILAIPFLIMGSLLMESYFGIPGLGDLMLTSINEGNEPILNGLVFLMALIYTVGVLVTDLSYAVFDPRIKLR